MDLNTNGARAIAILVALNAGLLFTHLPMHVAAQRPMLAIKSVNSGQICQVKLEAQKTKLEARKAAFEARYQVRVAAREITRQAVRAAMMAPTSATPKPRSSVTDYVHCMASSGTRSMYGGS